MKTLKRVLTLLFTATLVLSITACGGTPSSSGASSSTPASSTPASSTPASSTPASSGASSADASTPAAVEYPNGILEFICQYGAGGGLDICERILAKHLQEYYNENVIVTNTTGGNGSVGLTALYTSKPDGQTMGITFATEYVTAYISEFDYTKDNFDIVCQVNFDPNCLVIKKGGKFDGMTLPEILEYSKNNEVRWGVNGSWAAADFVRFYMGEYGFKSTRVLYDGGAVTMQAVLNGDIDIATAYPSECLSYVQSGDMEVIAVSTPERFATYPDSPTFAEQGYDKLKQEGIQRVIAVPAGTDPAIIAEMEKAFLSILSKPELIQEFSDAGMTTIPLGTEDARAQFNSILENYLKYINDNNYAPGDIPQ